MPVRLDGVPRAVCRPRRDPRAGRARDHGSSVPRRTRSRAGDEPATRAIDQTAWALGVALSGVVNVLDIPTVVLGGHLGQLADVLRPGLEGHLRTRVLSAVWRPPDVVAAGTGTAMGATGAALLELAGVLSSPALFL